MPEFNDGHNVVETDVLIVGSGPAGSSAALFLATLGVPAQRISTISYGEELPVCRDENEDCWQKNRHDRFVLKSSPTS